MSETSRAARPRRFAPAVAVAATAAIALLLASCSPADAPASDPITSGPAASASQAPNDAAAAILANHGLAGLTAVQVVDQLDALPLAERSSDLVVSIRPHELVVKDSTGAEGSVPMPADQFYVSFAPYVSSTHDCYFHSLTTCVGELQGVDVDLVVTDTATGEVILDETRSTFDNGFLGLWLPRGATYTVEFGYQGKSASVEVSTAGDDDATCVTTAHLA